MRSLERLGSEYDSAPGRFPQVKDKQRRIDRINEFVKMASSNLSDYEAFVKMTQSGVGDEENPSRGVRGADGEYDDTRDATNA